MSEILGLAARAILERVPQEYGMTEDEAKNYALAVIDALMEPTPEMVEAADAAGWDVGADASSSGLVHIYRAMLSKAKEGTGE